MDVVNMTRLEFEDEIADFDDLKYWCSEHECYICDNIYDEYSRDEIIDEQLVDWARDNGWQDLFQILNDIPTGDSYYLYDDYGDWHGVDYEFGDYKEEVLNWAIENNEFSEENVEEDEESEAERDPYELEPTEDEDISMEDMFSSEVIGVEAQEDISSDDSDDDEFPEIFEIDNDEEENDELS